MRLEAELDDIHAERLMSLQRRLKKTLPEIIASAIDNMALSHSTALEDVEPSPMYQALESIGFIGCIETDEQLSTTYKGKLNFSHKCEKS